MEKTYHIIPKLINDNGNPILNIKPISYGRKLIPYPISFKELNIPIKVSHNSIEGSELDYFLDFDRSYAEKCEDYGESCLNRPKLRKVLRDFEIAIDERLTNALCGIVKLGGKRVSFKSDNGLEINKRTRRYGKPKEPRMSGSPVNNKVLSA